MTKQKYDRPDLMPVRVGSAPKCGKGAEGLLSYAIAYQPDEEEVYLRITGNESGGLFTPEWVALSAIELALDGPPLDSEPFRSKLLASAFTGRSNNNAGFLAAILRKEGVLKPAASAEHLHQVATDFGKWRGEAAREAQKRAPKRGKARASAGQDDAVELEEEPDGDGE